MDELPTRITHAAESIMENESLTDGLDDTAAKVLLDWGIGHAQAIAQSTAGMSDAEAERAMSTRLRATRRVMRLANRWVAHRQEMGDERRDELLAEMVEQAAVIHGERSMLAASDRLGDTVTRGAAGQSPEAAADVRRLMEDLESSSSTRSEGANDSESQGQPTR
jgi:hypothetical protein